jgi:hypothetical protein
MNNQTDTNTIVTISRFLGILSLIATLTTTAAAVLQVIKPGWAIYALALSAAISAFTARVQGT